MPRCGYVVAMSTVQIVAENLRLHRARRRLRQSDLAALAGTSRSAIAAVEGCAYRGVSTELLDRIACGLGVEVADLVRRPGLTSPDPA